MTQKLIIGWLYPEFMSTYGDRGNVLVLKKRCEWRGVECNILPIDFSIKTADLTSVDIFFGGGAQDRQQTLIMSDLKKRIGPVMKGMIENGTPGLFVCGAPQLLGKSYITGDGTVLEGVGLFDIETKHFGHTKPRCIGNMIFEINSSYGVSGIPFKKTIVGFENHGGRTYLRSSDKSFGKIIIGFGNNAEDKTEGVVKENCIATYSHGPFLSKNPHIADWLIHQAMKQKYNKTIRLKKLDDGLEWKAHEYMLKRMGYEEVTPI